MRRNATLLVLISLLSGFGSTAMTLAAGIWVLDLTGSVGLAGLTALGLYAPVLAAPWLGALVDRLPRRPLMIGVDAAVGVLMLSLLTVTSARDAWLVFAVLLAHGVGYVLVDAGETAILPAALPPERLGDVNGWRSSAQEGMKLVAPLTGAGLYAWHGPVPVVLIGAATPLLTAACYGLMRVRPFAPADRAPGPAADGLRALLRDPDLRVPVLVAAVAIGLSGLVGAAILAQLVHVLHLPATRLGILSAAQGTGSIVAGLVVGRILARHPPAAIAGLGALIFAAGRLITCLPWWPALIAGSALAGIGLPWALIAAITAVQTRTPTHLLGRVGATANAAMFGSTALAIPLGSAMVHFGPLPPLLTAASAATAAGALALRHSAPATTPHETSPAATDPASR